MDAVKNKLLTFFDKYFGPEVPVRQRFFAILFTFGFLSGFSGGIACIIIKSSMETILLSIATCIIFPTLGFLGLRSEKSQETILEFAIFVLDFLIVPALYITGGAIRSGIPCYMIICLAFTMFLSRKNGLFLVVLQAVFYALLFYFSFAKPEWILELPAAATAYGQRKFTYQAVTSNALMTALLLGGVSKIMFDTLIKEDRLVKSAIREIERQSTIDPLTNIYNRRHMYKYLSAQIKAMRKAHKSLSIVMFDIDRFKRLNDTYGHLLGDDVLKAIARILKNSCRDKEIVARYGGEEFLLIMPGSDNEAAAKRAEEIRDCIEKSYLSPELPRDKPVTISGGVATLRSGWDEEKLVAAADENLYKSKENGRNRITS